MKKVFMFLCSALTLTACGGDDDTGGSASGQLEITLDDEQRNRTLNTVSYIYTSANLKNYVDHGAAGKGAAWDFSAVDMNQYEVKIKLIQEGKKEDYAASKYKEYYPNATECYVTRITHTMFDTGNLLTNYYTYTYLNGNIEYGWADEDHTVSEQSKTTINHLTPALTRPYPQYFGMKYTEKTSVSIEGDDSLNSIHSDIEIDGEGTLILPNGRQFTDVLRYKITTYDNTETIISYSYESKKFGFLADTSKSSTSCTFTFTDEWR